MKTTLISLALFALLLSVVAPSRAQTTDSSAQTNQSAGLERPDLAGGFSIFAGVSLPVGAFGATSGTDAGAASTGFVGGLQYAHPLDEQLQLLFSLSYTYNKMDDSPLQILRMLDPSLSIEVTSYTAICPLGGIRYLLPMPPRTTLFLDCQVGMMFSSSPDLKISGPSLSAHQASASASAFAFAVGGGLSFGIIDLSAQYLYAKPKYHTTATGSSSLGGSTQSADFEQPTASIQVVANLHL